MSPEILNDPEFETVIAAVSDLDGQALRARYRELKRHDLPKFLRVPFMQMVVAHALCEKKSGGLDRDTRRMLDQLVSQVVPNAVRPPQIRNRKIKTGTRLLRQWQGRVYEVAVEASGYTYDGKTFASLSAIAFEITGTKWNGWLFFGVSQKQKLKLAAARVSPKRISTNKPRKASVDGPGRGAQHG